VDVEAPRSLLEFLLGGRGPFPPGFIGFEGCRYERLDSLVGIPASAALADLEPLRANPPTLLSGVTISSLYLKLL
jgi:hypothetical protein